MITEYKIKIYQKYKGDIDSLARSGSKKEKIIMNNDDWFLIDAFVQDLFLIKKGLTSLEFKNNLNDRLNQNCDSDKTIKLIHQIPS